ncbi:MAG: UTRA domain-containing protein, partial [Dehalobacterium sp.]
HLVLNCEEIFANAIISEKLRLNENEPIYKIQRLRLFGDMPAIIENAYLQKSRFPGLERMDLSGRLQHILKDNYHIQLTHLTTIIEPIIASVYDARLLQIQPGSPCLLLWRISYSYDPAPVLCSTNIIRGDKCRLQING